MVDIPVDQKTVYYSLPMQMYMAEKIKKPLLQAFQILFEKQSSRLDQLKALKMLWKVSVSLKGLPEPTKGNTWHPNTHHLIDLRDWLIERLNLNQARNSFIRRVMNFVIVLYDFDPPWRFIFDSFKDEAMKKEWKPRGFCDSWTDTYNWWD
jgi:hypothetical protein